jgi:hypothetical protein
VRADHAEWDLAVLQQTDQVRAGHIQVIGGLLRGQLRRIRDDLHALPAGQQGGR